MALIKNGDIIDIDIEARSVNVELTDEQLDERRRELEAGDATWLTATATSPRR